MKILRLEDHLGRGPWNNGAIHRIDPLDKPDYYGKKHLDPSIDENIEMDDSDFVGVASMKDLLHWFPPKVLAFLQKKNFTISVYNIHKNSVRFGENQVVFEKQKAKLVEMFLPMDYEKVEV